MLYIGYSISGKIRNTMNHPSITYLDGAMGTMLQRAGLKTGEKPEVFGMLHPDVVREIHARYIEAGSDVIYTNTFGANARKYAGSEYAVADVIAANVATARQAAEHAAAKGRRVRVALDAGPLGELMEPLGTLSFEEAYDCFKEVVTAGESAGADLVIFETMTDLAEVRAAVLAAKENTSLPVWVTMTFEKSGRTFAGTDASAMALTLNGLGVDALGVNCSLGPEDLVPIVKRILERSDRPVIVKPNAGLPDPRSGLYAMTPERFAREMSVYPKMGIRILGGCCGTQPAFINALKEGCDRICAEGSVAEDLRTDGQKDIDSISGPLPEQPGHALRNGVCSAGRVTDLNGHVRVIGERINPTGKKRFQQALREHDMNYVMKCAIEQAEAGADILDINTGLPGADEVSLMRDVVRAVQSVTDLPLQIDSSTPAALEAGLRAANGRVIVNSVNAEEEKCRQILPLVKKYGACVIGLALKKSGTPQNARERIENVEAILRMTDEYGIPRSDVIIDCLALTVSAQQEQAMETLRAAEYVSRNFGVHCTLGVSNISFGLPQRKFATVSFLTQAMYCGVDLPIINPNQLEIMDAVASFRALSGQDPSCAAYIERFASRPKDAPASGVTVSGGGSAAPAGTPGVPSSAGAEGSGSQAADPAGPALGDAGAALRKAVIAGLPDEVRTQTRLLLEQKQAMEIIEQDLIPALDVVGERYEKQILFLPQLINAANAASAGFDLIKNRIAETGEGSVSRGEIILATVEGDIHDIGKNIVKVVLENYGFTVYDLGRDVPPETVRDAAIEHNIRMVGLSALMTTTLPAMERTIRVLREAGLDCRVVVGGAVVTQEYANEIGADCYARDARETVEYARSLFEPN